MKTGRPELGLARISRRFVADTADAPVDKFATPNVLPPQSEMDQILRPPSLDERVSDMLRPAHIDADLMSPMVLAATREAAQQNLHAAAREATGQKRESLMRAAAFLADEQELDHEIREGLAALLRG